MRPRPMKWSSSAAGGRPRTRPWLLADAHLRDERLFRRQVADPQLAQFGLEQFLQQFA
jgi:hypothetical protein